MTLPNRKEMGPILIGAGVFVLTTYAAIHQFIYPRSEAEAAVMVLSKRQDDADAALAAERKERLEDRKDFLLAVQRIQDYIMRK
jgi:hypothetical protein